LDVIQQVIQAHKRVVIFLGISPIRCTKNNPLDFQTRKDMITAAFNVEVHYIEDTMDDEVWSKILDREIARILEGAQDAILYGSRDSFIQYYSGELKAVELTSTKVLSARKIRKEVGERLKNTQEFREGVIWAVENQHPAVLPTVDIAILNCAKNELLLATKANEKQMRFVGGFADVGSNSFEDDAKREVREETGLDIQDPIYIGSSLIDDWRYKNEKDKIKTLFFYAKYIRGAPKAGDDIAGLCWVNLSKIIEADLVSAHVPLLRMLKRRLNEILG